ncbi:MAG: helix-turn-helix transcriptional regulator [Paracoccaceae bacterium]
MEPYIPFEGLIVTVYSSDSAPVALGCFKAALDFQSGLKNYLEYTYVLNPVYRAFLNDISSGAYLITDLMPKGYGEQVASSDLRIRIEDSEVLGYRTPGWPKNMTDVLGLIQLPDNMMIELDFITTHSNNQTGQCFKALKSMFPVLASAVRKHFETASHEIDTIGAQPSHEDRFQQFGKSTLTNREQSVVKMILTGHSSNSIALSLGISMPTVKTHRRNTYAKLNISSQAELFNLFIQTLVDSAA